jgi:hypothetical protein
MLGRPRGGHEEKAMRYAVYHDSMRGCDSSGGWARAACVVGAAIGFLVTAWQPAFAAAEIRGRRDNLQVHLQNASVREVLDALASRYKMTYKLPPNVDRVLTGQYSGTLHQVLTRVLDGNDYVVQASGDRIEVVVFGPSRTTAVATHPQAPAPKVAPAPAPKVGTVRPSSTPSEPPPLDSFLAAGGPAAEPTAGGPP